MVKKRDYEKGQRLIRLIRLLFKIQSHPGINSKSLSEEMGVSERQVYRDLQTLEYADVPFDRSQGYRFMQESYLKPFCFGWGELIAMYLASSVLTSQKHDFLAQGMKIVLEKIEMQLDDEIRNKLTKIKDRLSVRLAESERPIVNQDIFDVITQAFITQHSVKIKYYSMSKDELTEREVDPYAVVCQFGSWYIVGYCHLRNELRIFRASRIKHIELTERSFIIPKEFSLKWELGQVVVKGKEMRVSVKFDKGCARFIKEQEWLPNQKIKKFRNGGIILSGMISNIETFKDWILGWGPHAEVLSPLSLRQMIKQNILQMATRYK